MESIMASANDEGDMGVVDSMTESASHPPASYSDFCSDWETKFIDDLVAANHFKTFLVTQGTKVPDDVLRGLAAISAVHRREMDLFVKEERRRNRLLQPFWRRSEYSG
jgi:hypothetical protein